MIQYILAILHPFTLRTLNTKKCNEETSDVNVPISEYAATNIDIDGVANDYSPLGVCTNADDMNIVDGHKNQPLADAPNYITYLTVNPSSLSKRD